MKSRIFFITYLAASAGLILYGVIALIQPDVLLKPFLAYVYQFPSVATGAVTYLSGLYRLLGYLNVIPGMLGLLLLYRYWVTRQEWYLKIVIASTILTYLGPVVFDNTVGTIGFFEILEHIIFMMTLISGYMMVRQEGSMSPQSTSLSSSGKPLPRELNSGFPKSQNTQSNL